MMPVYCYSTDDGEVIERMYSMFDDRPVEITLEDGRVARRDMLAEHGGFRHTVANWPQEGTIGACVHPSQVKDTMTYMAKEGCPTEIKPNGNIVFRDRHHRAKALKTLKWIDRDAGYSDPN